MKRLYFIILLLSTGYGLSSQDNVQNYILARTMLNELGAQYIDHIQYFDGFNFTQNVQIKVSSRSNLIAYIGVC